jgi:DNA-binding CsgD family transcriptional regulator
MAADLKLRARNKRWLRQVGEGELTIEEIARDEDVSERTVQRGLRDAERYPEMSRFVRWLKALATGMVV